MSQLTEFINKYIIDNSIITGSPGVGTTSLVQAIANELCLDHSVLYYNPSNTINRDFIKRYYNNMFNNVTVITGDIDVFLEYLINNVMDDVTFDYIIVDPGDVLMDKSNILCSIESLLDPLESKLICTSQIRSDPNNSQVYSTLEKWNFKYNNKLFKYSIWLRNVTTPNEFYKMKYIDVFQNKRIGNRYDDRYIVRVSKTEGNIL